jgi:hypothetical protein
MAAAPRSTPALVHFRPAEGALQLDANVLGLATLGVTSVKNNGQVPHSYRPTDEAWQLCWSTRSITAIIVVAADVQCKIIRNGRDVNGSL